MKQHIFRALPCGISGNKCNPWYETDHNRYKCFFDLIGIAALPEFFALEYEICTTDFVVKEVLQSHQKEQVEAFIRAQKLTVFKLTADEIDEGWPGFGPNTKPGRGSRQFFGAQTDF